MTMHVHNAQLAVRVAAAPFNADGVLESNSTPVECEFSVDQVALDTAKRCPKLGRFILRVGSTLVGGGVIKEVHIPTTYAQRKPEDYKQELESTFAHATKDVVNATVAAEERQKLAEIDRDLARRRFERAEKLTVRAADTAKKTMALALRHCSSI